MVLQGAKDVPIWGRAAPGAAVSVRWLSHAVEATADAQGQWRARLDLSERPAEPFVMTVSTASGAPAVTIKNVAVGEVWLAAGQSNMEKPVGPHAQQQPVDHWQEEVAASANPEIRVFTVAGKYSDRPEEQCSGKWEVAGPGTTARFSAVAYFFARELQRTLHRPVGMIVSAWGGTRVEPWISRAGFARVPAIAPYAEAELALAAKYRPALQRYHADLASWSKAHGYDGAESGDGWADFALPTNDWKPAALGSARVAPGVQWYRTEFDIPPEWEGTTPLLQLPAIAGFDTVFLNGTRIGGVDFAHGESVAGDRHYLLPSALVKPGHATLAVKVIVQKPVAGIMAQAWRLALIANGPKAHLAPWLTKTQAEFPPLGDEARQSYPTPPATLPGFDTATELFNGQIHPLIPYALAGFIWYQGESNAKPSPWVSLAHSDGPSPAALYAETFPALIRDWRQAWSAGGWAGALPFYYCQLANFGPVASEPGESAWAEVREAQRRTMANVPQTGMAVLIDVGLARDIHPTNKQDAGHRLALWALGVTYGVKGPISGPLHVSSAIEGSRIRIHFSEVAGGLVAHPLPPPEPLPAGAKPPAPASRPRPASALAGFEICGADRHYVWAEAHVEGDTVVVSAPEVPEPRAVRYAWADNPLANLYNGAGLPASPFQTEY